MNKSLLTPPSFWASSREKLSISSVASVSTGFPSSPSSDISLDEEWEHDEQVDQCYLHEAQTPEKLDGLDYRTGIRVLTLNTLFSPVPFNRAEALRMEGLLACIIEGKYDVVCFQEFIESCLLGIDPDGHKSRMRKFVQKMRSIGFEYHIQGPMPCLCDAGKLDGGCVIFSKFRFVETSLVPWKRNISWDAWAHKGIVHALIEIPAPCQGLNGEFHAAHLHIITLHAQAEHRGWQDIKGVEAYRDVRISQMRQLAEFVNEKSTDGNAVLVLGDFNFDARNILEREKHLAEWKEQNQAHVDVIYDSFKCHPPTFGAVNDDGQPIETYLTQVQCQCQNECLDHVYFWPGTDSFPFCTCKGEVLKPRCSPDHFTTSHCDQPLLTHVSDHLGWGVDVPVKWTVGETCTCPTAVKEALCAGYAAKSSRLPKHTSNNKTFSWYICCGGI